MDEHGFIFEDLRVYQRSLKLSVDLIRIAVKFPFVYSRIRDQFIGAAISIPLNLAEGSGRISAKDKRNFYKNARGSAFEIIPLLEIIYNLGLISLDRKEYFRKECADIGRIISSLMK